ncbi:hypothetical protein DMUE_1510 [Dictyocoela muelleri]|nr:hypothetical protein DMUE_1510 [Dictyocoela muelleri]
MNSIRKIKIDIDSIVSSILNNFCKIGGEGAIVEIDETKFGKRKYNRGRRVDGVWVLGGVERSNERKIFLDIIENRKSDTLLNIIKNRVFENSIIFTDMWRGYINLNTIGFSHYTVKHHVSFVNRENGAHTNTIEGTWAALKEFIPKRYRSYKYVKPYLNIFMLKRNSNKKYSKNFLSIFLIIKNYNFKHFVLLKIKIFKRYVLLKIKIL